MCSHGLGLGLGLGLRLGLGLGLGLGLRLGLGLGLGLGPWNSSRTGTYLPKFRPFLSDLGTYVPFDHYAKGHMFFSCFAHMSFSYFA